MKSICRHLLLTALMLGAAGSATAATPSLLGLLLGQPAISLSPASLDFGPRTVGTATSRGLTVTNSGKASLKLGSIVLAGAQAADYAISGCSNTTLAPGASCTIQVRFQPRAAGSRAATLTVNGNAPSRSASLSGSGVQPTPPPATTRPTPPPAASPQPAPQPTPPPAAQPQPAPQPAPAPAPQPEPKPQPTPPPAASPQPAPAPAPTPPPSSGSASGYRAVNGQIVNPAGQTVQIRGLNMFGFNSDILAPQYLWAMNWKAQIQQVKDLGFNTIRVPYVPETLYSTAPAGGIDASLNPELAGKTPLQVLDLWLAELDRQGLYFVLDFHSVAKGRLHGTWYTNDGSITWNGQPYSEDHWVRDLVFVAKRYASNAHFMGIDLYNEPNGEVRWGDGDKAAYKPEADWKRASEKAGNAILQANGKLLIFVEGIHANWDGVEDPNVPLNWGENLRPQSYRPLQIPNAKLVFTPHTYGPDVFQKPTFDDPNYPRNLAQHWEELFGKFSPQHPIVMGEFGGFYGTGPTGAKDRQWQDAFVDYLISKNIRGGFYWCYTPNSGDTGGVLDDNLKVREDKMALLRRLWGQ